MQLSRAVVAVGLVLTAVGCSSAAPSHNDADAAFVLHMLPHHQRALEVAALAAATASDPRVTAFGERIVSEQTPEEQNLTRWVDDLDLPVQPDDSTMADGYIDDTAFARLKTESGTTFDRDFLLLSALSEEGAAAMANVELQGGTYEPALTLAQSISTAPDTQIPELRDLANQLP
ncbi:hypothetical protein GCM10007304_06010 [Rhodococcoides trifolii]|uniref:DUF305 domain-containing protein n=1 Tax=Rhodococcoides trifolii TaxID=908250 RepID=A0A917FPM9_9NOCA|nr:DUF305 domain-containing protein [Rhodococcus trifolii]GGF94965.1 hypothetical protein GCM10007304_06010 [Rhodococcus trifolii]